MIIAPTIPTDASDERQDALLIAQDITDGRASAAPTVREPSRIYAAASRAITAASQALASDRARSVSPPAPEPSPYALEGLASWYGGRFQGRTTANGETFDTNTMTAAHRTLPFDSVVRVINPADNSSVEVRINDRGPFIEGRIIDLSRVAAEAIGVTKHGVLPVTLEIIKVGGQNQKRSIQVGSFALHENATDLSNVLQRAGFSPTIEKTTDGALHRVVVQDVTSADLDGYMGRLAQLGYSGVLVRKQQIGSFLPRNSIHYLGASPPACLWQAGGVGVAHGLRLRSSLAHLRSQMGKTACGALRIPCALAHRIGVNYKRLPQWAL